MGRDAGGYLCNVVADKPGKFVKYSEYPFFNANSSVVSTGEINAAWANATRFAGEAHNLVAGFHLPVKMGMPA